MNPIKSFYLAAREPFPILRRARASFAMAFNGTPLCSNLGFGRGTPIHRHHVEACISGWREDIKGHCVEFQCDLYTTASADPGTIDKLDIIDLSAENERATVVTNLMCEQPFPDGTLDYINNTFVFHAIYDVRPMVDCLWRMLKPGGIMHVAVPGLLMVNGKYGDVWRYTRLSLEHVLNPVFGGENVCIESFGNSYTASAEMRGLAVEDVAAHRIPPVDDLFPIVLCARCVKA